MYLYVNTACADNKKELYTMIPEIVFVFSFWSEDLICNYISLLLWQFIYFYFVLKIVHPKTDEQRCRLQEACKDILLFKNLDQVILV